MESEIDLTGCTFEDDSNASIARRTKNPKSPYLVYSERENFEERAIREGTVVAIRRVYRWGSAYSFSPWTAPNR